MGRGILESCLDSPVYDQDNVLIFAELAIAGDYYQIRDPVFYVVGSLCKKICGLSLV